MRGCSKFALMCHAHQSNMKFEFKYLMWECITAVSRAVATPSTLKGAWDSGTNLVFQPLLVLFNTYLTFGAFLLKEVLIYSGDIYGADRMSSPKATYDKQVNGVHLLTSCHRCTAALLHVVAGAQL